MGSQLCQVGLPEAFELLNSDTEVRQYLGLMVPALLQNMTKFEVRMLVKQTLRPFYQEPERVSAGLGTWHKELDYVICSLPTLRV